MKLRLRSGIMTVIFQKILYIDTFSVKLIFACLRGSIGAMVKSFFCDWKVMS
uniref:ABC transporter C family member 13 isoform X3 n=1 Tax=Rhizophora mucronata TaxID=61149 RepID=A0A2P2M4J7_RHIMU